METKDTGAALLGAAPHWRRELHAWANGVLQSFVARPDVLGVALGGSLARGMEWKHSDIEMAIVVEERLSEFGYFNIYDGRGVEVFQFVAAEWRDRIAQAERDPLAVLDWPIQMYQCRIVADPLGLLTPFKQCFDSQLFHPAVVEAKTAHELAQFDREFAVAQADLAAGRPLTALAQLRAAFNNLILAFYWRHGILPRSQNRTESLLRRHCQSLGRMDFYELFHDVYGLDLPAGQARRLLADCRAEVADIVAGFGPHAADFFYYAVDGEFRWEQTKGILTVYRLYVPWCLRHFQRQEGVFDNPTWREAHHTLCEFVGLAQPDAECTAALLARTQALRTQLAAG
jgi:hypothetical protein